MNKKSHPKCVLVDWCGNDENVGEGRIVSSDPDDLVNDCRLGPNDLKAWSKLPQSQMQSSGDLHCKCLQFRKLLDR